MKLGAESVRNIVFGIEDSLVSTVGLISGVAFAGVPRLTLVLTGVILIFVEAFSMAVGSLLSDNSVREFKNQTDVPISKSIKSAAIMFVSYFVVGFAVIVPYFLINDSRALLISILISVIFLFVLGVFSGKMSRGSPIKKGFSMVIIGGGAIFIGMTVGALVNSVY
ncbi:MAG: VIT1/CCC1 transporter family protein [Candidatus Vogelbacteria bacterium]